MPVSFAIWPPYVLNANDIDRRCNPLSPIMSFVPLPNPPQCPDPSARAPCVSSSGEDPCSILHLAPAGLQGAIVAILCRDTRGVVLSDAQRLTHFPASPRVCLSWFQGLDAGVVERTGGRTVWRPFNSAVVVSGSQSKPTVCWAPGSGRSVMVCFVADAASAIFGIDLSIVQDRIVPASELLGDAWQPFLAALLAAEDDAASLAVLEAYLVPTWRALQGSSGGWSSLREAGRYWIERLAWQAHEWRKTRSPRQVERRIKALSGRSLREWKFFVKAESLFFNVREQYDAGGTLDWAAIASDEGFADQAHLNRAVKRSTGFAPGEFSQRFKEDESFWLYRLWM
jgi:AraC-like DNA-binding protein